MEEWLNSRVLKSLFAPSQLVYCQLRTGKASGKKNEAAKKPGCKAELLCIALYLLTLLGFCMKICEIIDCNHSLAERSGFVSQLHKTSEQQTG